MPSAPSSGGEPRPPAPAGSRPAPPRALSRARVGALALLVGLYALDQGTKWWVVAHLQEGRPVTVVDGLLWWHLLRNPGAAFSLGESVTWVFTLIMAGVAAWVVWLLPRARSVAWLLALSGLLAGVLGNLTDRLFRDPGFGRGHVVDFIALPHYAVFNVADSCICLSIAGIVVLLLRDVPLAGCRTSEGTVPGPVTNVPEENRR